MRLVLHALVEEPSRRHHGSELSEAVGLSAGIVYPLLARLERPMRPSPRSTGHTTWLAAGGAAVLLGSTAAIWMAGAVALASFLLVAVALAGVRGAVRRG
ncbi:MAG: hypothetical protein ACJ73S_10485 [Mycobacteriales bacterium]